VTSLCDELFVVVDRRPRGELTIDVYDTSLKNGEVRAVDEFPSDPDPIGPEVLTPQVQGIGYSDEDTINEWTNRRSEPSRSIGLPGSRSLSLSDLARAADAEEEESEVDVEAVDWFGNLERRGEIADVLRSMTLDAATVDNSLQIDIIKVTL